MFTLMGPNESIKSGSGLNHPSQHRFYLQIDILLQFMITYLSQGTILYFPPRKIFESAAVSPPRKHFGICAGTFWDGNWPVVWFSIQHISILHTIRQVIWQIRPHKLLCKSSDTSLEILTRILLIICHIFSHVTKNSWSIFCLHFVPSCSELVLLCASMSSETWTKSGCDGNCTTTFLFLTPESMQS